MYQLSRGVSNIISYSATLGKCFQQLANVVWRNLDQNCYTESRTKSTIKFAKRAKRAWSSRTFKNVKEKKRTRSWTDWNIAMLKLVLSAKLVFKGKEAESDLRHSRYLLRLLCQTGLRLHKIIICSWNKKCTFCQESSKKKQRLY